MRLIRRSEDLSLAIILAGIALYVVFDAFEIWKAVFYAFIIIAFFILCLFATKSNNVDKENNEEKE